MQVQHREEQERHREEQVPHQNHRGRPGGAMLNLGEEIQKKEAAQTLMEI